ncbi:MAG: acetate--CoA ligase family protein [bacterium]
MHKFFSPESIAIVGASREKGKVGYEILSNIILSGFKGKIFPINPSADEILERKCFSSLFEIKERIELAIIIVKNTIVPNVLEECGRLKIKNAIIISAGFKEAGIAGLSLENKIKEIAKNYEIKIIGPNCLGLIDTQTPLNASFSRIFPEKGTISFISQSGALCTAILDWAKEKNISFSKFISFGNGCDVAEIELIEYLIDCPNTSVIALYLEGTKDGKRFIDIASRSKKPIILYKSGKTDAGKRAISSHTGSLAGSEKAWESAISLSGIIKVDSIEKLFLFSHSFATQEKPKGRNMVILTNAGGPGIIASDCLVGKNISLSVLPKETVNLLKENLPPSASPYNPVDILGDALSDRYNFAIETITNEPGVDGIIVILTPQAMTEIEKTAEIIIKFKDKKPIFPVFMGGAELTPAISLFKKHNIINYLFPEDCVSYLSACLDAKKPHIHKELPEFHPKRDIVMDVFNNAKAEGRNQLSEIEAYKVIGAYGIPYPKTFLAKSLKEISEIDLEYPLVAKIASPDILHKSDIGGVLAGIKTKDELKIAYIEIIENAKRLAKEARIFGVLIQEEAPKGQELIIGLNKDPQFGHLLMVGLGGIYVEVLKDVSFGIIPVCYDCCKDMLYSLKSYPILHGIRGEKGIDFESVISTILKISQLSMDFPDIISLDINPLRAYNKGCFSLDCKIILEE